MIFSKAYKAVFNENGEVKLCGRERCKELIRLCDEIEPSISHGNLDLGYMNIEAIQRLARVIGIEGEN